MLFYIGLASQAGKFEGAQKNESSSWLPADAESVKALKAIKQLPGGELAPAVIVYERRGGLTDADKARIDETVAKLNADRRRWSWRRRSRSSPERRVRADRRSRSSPATARATRSRTRCSRSATGSASPPDGLEVKLTGAAGFSLDAIKVFGGINGTLLLRGGADRAGPADHHLPLADLLGDPVLQRRCSPRARRAARATCWPRRA